MVTLAITETGPNSKHRSVDTSRNVGLISLMWIVLHPVSAYELLRYYAN